MVNTNTIIGFIAFVVGSILAMVGHGSFESNATIVGAILSTAGLVFIGLTLSGAIGIIGAHKEVVVQQRKAPKVTKASKKK